MLSKREFLISFFKFLTGLFLLIMLINTSDKMIFSNENNIDSKSDIILISPQEEDHNETKRFLGINLKNLKKPVFSLYLIAIFLGLAWNAKLVLKIGIC